MGINEASRSTSRATGRLSVLRIQWKNDWLVGGKVTAIIWFFWWLVLRIWKLCGTLKLNYQATALFCSFSIHYSLSNFLLSVSHRVLLPLSCNMQATIQATGYKLNSIRYLSSLSCHCRECTCALRSRNSFRDWKSNRWHGHIHVAQFCGYTMRWMHI